MFRDCSCSKCVCVGALVGGVQWRCMGWRGGLCGCGGNLVAVCEVGLRVE